MKIIIQNVKLLWTFSTFPVEANFTHVHKLDEIVGNTNFNHLHAAKYFSQFVPEYLHNIYCCEVTIIF
jgi:hypothetical protein